MLTIPKNQNRSGVKIKCLACKYQVSKICPQSGRNISTCENSDQHRFNLVVCVPNSTARRTKVVTSTNFTDALIERQKFINELKEHGFHKPLNLPSTSKVMNYSMAYLMAEYLDSLSGTNTPRHLIKVRSKSHVADCRLAFTRFCKALKDRKYNPELIDIREIGDDEVGFYHEYLLDEVGLSPRSYQKHIVICRSFFNWLRDVREYNVPNAFRHVELSIVKKEKQIISKKEFEKLLEVTTKENGLAYYSGCYRNVFRPWLTFGFRLALETGLRTEEIVILKWSDIIDLGEGVLVIRVSNLKVNRIQTGEDEGHYIKHIPVTKGLMDLLVEMGYQEKLGTDLFIIDRANQESTANMMSAISKGFNHYIKQVTSREIKFKTLRKTYLTHFAIALGDKAKLFTNQSDETLKNHYLSSAFLAGNLNKFSIF
jgi:integrase